MTQCGGRPVTQCGGRPVTQCGGRFSAGVVL